MCDHPGPLLIDTGWLTHVFCCNCGGYLTTFLDPTLSASITGVDRRRQITLDGVTRSTAEWARHYGINAGTIRNRLSKGWTERAAITTPVGVVRTC